MLAHFHEAHVLRDLDTLYVFNKLYHSKQVTITRCVLSDFVTANLCADTLRERTHLRTFHNVVVHQGTVHVSSASIGFRPG